MARLPRIDLPGIPQHIVQRGNNRLPCFLDDGDRLRYLHLLHEALHATGCQLHVSTPRNSVPAKTRGLRLMLITELGGR
ncbi:hypothetical protein VDF76_18285, partial [Xanthomonas campestris pv. raphani]|uniref:transposase n=1 Tax=Xanthomonas campestris TaxID=339 RepID=UPI002B3AB48E|nr:hypothetical protein [Xanthomonas campestris pv. raphani]MEA9849637.1 hypothetical protein [Xanthomonas campestris pv. raphani]MEA9930864.1 hypothetical protein [Xanthomonas campestris pv. raphani]